MACAHHRSVIFMERFRQEATADELAACTERRKRSGRLFMCGGIPGVVSRLCVTLPRFICFDCLSFEMGLEMKHVWYPFLYIHRKDTRFVSNFFYLILHLIFTVRQE